MELQYKHLKTWRKALGWTQREVADKLEMRQGQYSELENGTSSNWHYKTIVKVCRVFNKEPRDLIPETTQTEIWAILCTKGGAGKTTITFTLAYFLSLLGYKVLVVENEMQVNITHYCMTWIRQALIKKQKSIGKTDVMSLEDIDNYFANLQQQINTHNIATLITKDSHALECIIDNEMIPFDFLPGHMDHINTPHLLQSPHLSGGDQRLALKLRPVKDYDIILIDNPGSSGDFNKYALNMATKAVMVIPAELSGVYSINPLMPLIDDTRTVTNPKLRSLHIVPNLLKNRKIPKEALNTLNDFYQPFLLYPELLHDKPEFKTAKAKKELNKVFDYGQDSKTMIGIGDITGFKNFTAGLDRPWASETGKRGYKQMELLTNALLHGCFES